jgi:hypothetical protein
MALRKQMTSVVLVVLMVCGQSWAQAEFSPPPLVPVPEGPGTPPPPAGQPAPTTPAPYGQPPPFGTQPQTTPYPYSSFGEPMLNEKPPPEIGLMVSEGLFGMLTAAGVSLLPYFLLDASGLLSNDTVGSVLAVVIFGAVPLATAQTQISIANGSRFYTSDMWPAALAGLGAQAAVLGLFYATGWLPSRAGGGVGGVPAVSGSVPLLLIGTSVVVPLIQMAVINLTKQPKFRLSPSPPSTSRPSMVEVNPPSISPYLAQTNQGPSLGVALSLFSGRF